MNKSQSKLIRLMVLFIVIFMLSSQAFEIVAYARGGSRSSSHSSRSHSTTRRASSSKSTPSSGAKSGSFSASPKSSSNVGSSATKSSSSPKSTYNKNGTVVVNNHTYVSHPSNSYLFFHRTYYVDNYGTRQYMPYRPNFGGIFLGIIIIGVIVYVVIRIKKNRR